jgi:putative FmdB family regulatory protein
MPTYEYACKSCGKHLDVQQSFTDDSLTTCPSCGGPLRKVFGNIAIAFKGSGFYSTDNRSVAKSGGTKESTDGSAKSETSSDSKPDAKTDTKGDSKSDSKSESSTDSGGSSKSESAAGGSSKAEPKSSSGEKAKAAATPTPG